MEFKVNITEVLSRVIAVEADSKEEALIRVSDMYNSEEIVLDYSDFNDDVKIEIICEKSESPKTYR